MNADNKLCDDDDERTSTAAHIQQPFIHSSVPNQFEQCLSFCFIFDHFNHVKSVFRNFTYLIFEFVRIMMAHSKSNRNENEHPYKLLTHNQFNRFVCEWGSGTIFIVYSGVCSARFSIST